VSGNEALGIGAIVDLGHWLRNLGLERFEQAFQDNAIDETVLPHLTEDHLRELGLPLGVRIKLLAAIAALSTQPALNISATMTVATSAPEAAERRQITVLFSDLVGSTALSTRLDPEDLRNLISAYQKCVTETVRNFGGFVAKYMGDGVLVYFGYPQAHEDDAERAVRSGLELIAEIAKLKTQPPLHTRVGIATGLVVVGDLVGSGEAQERGIVGETPNLAARLQGLAEPDMVVIADPTRRLVGNLFELRDLGHQELKGIAGAVQVWAALRPGSVEGRFDAFHRNDLTSFVGREDESQLILRRWERAKSAEGQVVLISGEAGIGKSRLSAIVLQQISEGPHARLRCFCSPQRTDSALYPFIDHLERAARLAHDDTVHAKLDKLDALLARSATSPDDAALLAELLLLPNDGRYPAVALDAQERRKRTLEAFIVQVEALSRSEPVLMIFEDAHWTDPTSLELVGRILERIAELRVLLIVTFRPEFEPPWIGLPHVTTVTINRLGRRDINAIIDRIVGNKFLAPAIREDMIDRSDGIPLFIEEMTKAVLEAENQEDAQKVTAAIPSAKLEIPATLHASLMARLDRLGPAKELAQIGAAIGREFSHRLIESIAGKSQVELETALHRLIDAGLLFRRGIPPHANYTFKHALVQDAAYSTLLREYRRRLHAKIAQTLETQFAETAERQPELVARHYTHAGLIEKAAGLWGKAGQRSLEQSALAEAVEQLNRALSQTAALPDTPMLRRERIRLQLSVSNALMHVRGYAAPETRASLDQASLQIKQVETLGEPLEDPLVLFSVLYGLWVASYNAFDGDSVRERAAQCLAAAEKEGATIPLMVGHRLMGISLVHTGDLTDGRMHLDRAEQLFDPAKHRPLATRFGQDIGVGILYQRALPQWMLGYPGAALADCARAVSNSRDIGQAATLMVTLLYTSIVQILCGNEAVASHQANELVGLASDKGGALWRAFGVLLKGAVLTLTGRSSEAGETLSSGISALQSAGSTLWTPLWLSYLAKSCADRGQIDDAWGHMGKALKTIETSKETLFAAEVNRLAGEIALFGLAPYVTNAETYFAQALAIARGQQARSWELRAAMSLARFWRDQDKVQQARDLLTPVYGWFTEGFDTRDLREAKTLLDSL
jgi:class 3 adenylate cyclase/predicted ATPase